MATAWAGCSSFQRYCDRPRDVADGAEDQQQHHASGLDAGRDVVVLVDSITRMGRAYNQHGTGSRIQHELEGPVLRVPDACRLVPSGGQQPPVVGAEADGSLVGR